MNNWDIVDIVARIKYMTVRLKNVSARMDMLKKKWENVLRTRAGR